MELNITDFFNNVRAPDYSASIAELGDNAAAITWAAAIRETSQWPDLLDTDEKREEYRRHIRGFGAWDEAEVAAFSDTELSALLIQEICADIRESGIHDGTTWEEYSADSEAGRVSGNLFRGDTGGIFYYVGE